MQICLKIDTVDRIECRFVQIQTFIPYQVFVVKMLVPQAYVPPSLALSVALEEYARLTMTTTTAGCASVNEAMKIRSTRTHAAVCCALCEDCAYVFSKSRNTLKDIKSHVHNYIREGVGVDSKCGNMLCFM